MKKALHWYTYINLLIIAIATLTLGYWYFLDGDIVNPVLVDKIDTLNLATDKAVYRAGEPVSSYVAFCKYRDLPALVNTRFVDGEIVLIDTTQNNLPVGCYGVDKPYTSISAIVIPPNLYPGTWHLEWTVEYQINPIKTITYQRRTQDFIVR